MTIVYRLENIAGEGVYACASSCIEHDWNRHPMPIEDSLLMWNLDNSKYPISKCHFGFISLDQLRAWFYNDKWLTNVSEHGVLLSVYDVEDVYIGNTQVVFVRGDVEPVERYDLVQFFKL
jgi:hypothetical protein